MFFFQYIDERSPSFSCTKSMIFIDFWMFLCSDSLESELKNLGYLNLNLKYQHIWIYTRYLSSLQRIVDIFGKILNYVWLLLVDSSYFRYFQYVGYKLLQKYHIFTIVYVFELDRGTKLIPHSAFAVYKNLNLAKLIFLSNGVAVPYASNTIL